MDDNRVSPLFDSFVGRTLLRPFFAGGASLFIPIEVARSGTFHCRCTESEDVSPPGNFGSVWAGIVKRSIVVDRATAC